MSMACKGIICPEKLPPSERAAYFHGLRTHFQVLNWSLLDDEFDQNVENWGWKQKASMLTPIATDKEMAPAALVKIIRCSCKLSGNNPCGTKISTCRKYGISCLSSCGQCRGTECNNRE